MDVLRWVIHVRRDTKNEVLGFVWIRDLACHCRLVIRGREEIRGNKDRSEEHDDARNKEPPSLLRLRRARGGWCKRGIWLWLWNLRWWGVGRHRVVSLAIADLDMFVSGRSLVLLRTILCL